jgi:hypothetical protein
MAMSEKAGLRRLFLIGKLELLLHRVGGRSGCRGSSRSRGSSDRSRGWSRSFSSFLAAGGKSQQGSNKSEAFHFEYP